MKNTVIGAFIAGLLVACGSGVVATSGSDEARISALEATVQQQATQIAALQTSVNALSTAAKPAVFIKAPNAATLIKTAMSKGRKPAAVDPSTCTGLGTLTGRPDNSNPITSDLLAGLSCTGYLYVITQAVNASEQSVLQGLPVRSYFYATYDCTGPAYVSRNGTYGLLSSGVFQSGVVLRAPSSPAAPTDPNDPSTYFYLPALGQTTSAVFGSYVTSLLNGVNCQSLAGLPQPQPPVEDAIELLPNDPAVTGFPSAPIPGPVTIGAG